MTHVAEWKANVFLFEEDDVTKARVTLDTNTSHLAGHGTARISPHDLQVPEIGDELAAGRALADLGRQLIRTAAEDVEGLDP
ncbi:DUF1876 domain-containing protein [Streptomyces sp. RB6PN25]|uniref:DUF1876 domain-containing protein n=1 Tax=Streptomyces humicola TaxID=2953240 RepID=A0ABT1PZV2_9ACTN|nr:dsRBD fold-containing protein [Streptomyces humicola]MCQ4082055.1 DUF1876 domain-containing protein [Streptomyces humicola]